MEKNPYVSSRTGKNISVKSKVKKTHIHLHAPPKVVR